MNTNDPIKRAKAIARQEVRILTASARGTRQGVTIRIVGIEDSPTKKATGGVPVASVLNSRRVTGAQPKETYVS